MLLSNTKKISGLMVILGSSALHAHVEYYDLNQGAQISDLTATGKTASTTQYGTTPTAVLALNGPPKATGIGTIGISSQQDLPLNNTSFWNTTYQAYTGVGSFAGVVYTPSTSSATVNVNDVTDLGWANGTKTTLGDSHKVDFFNFRLSQTSTITISWNIDSAGTYIDSGFSLYRGFLVYQGHDDSTEQLNPSKIGVGKVQNTLDNGSFVDVQGILSTYRNTATGAPTYTGQFNALGNWSQANSAGQWSAIEFISAVNTKIINYSNNSSDTIETLTITLPAGNYTIAASGALGAVGSGNTSFGLTGLHGRLIFSANAIIPDGDANGNGVVDIVDLLAIQRHFSGETTLSGNVLMRCDLYPVGAPDGQLTISDQLLMMRKISGL